MDAYTVYQPLSCGPIIVWLHEAAGESPVTIRMAIAAMKRDANGRAQTEAKIRAPTYHGSELSRYSSNKRGPGGQCFRAILLFLQKLISCAD